jgi:hypothetical protein
VLLSSFKYPSSFFFKNEREEEGRGNPKQHVKKIGGKGGQSAFLGQKCGQT